MSHDERWPGIRAFFDERARSHSSILDWGYTPLADTLPGADKLDTWLQTGMHADMDWMLRTAELRKHPRRHWEGMRSALVLLWKYPRPLPREPEWIAAYAHGTDYHYEIAATLKQWCAELAETFPGLSARHFVDSLPVAERELAAQAGLGWPGRHTLLIHPRHGSAFFIAGLLLSCECPEQPQEVEFAQGCTHCRKCLEACPTGAITPEGFVDARRCISYLTIEHRGPFREDQQASTGHTLFGCDICQTVCPYNKKHLENSPPYWPTGTVEWLQKAPQGNGLSRMLRGTPLERTGRKGLLRNLQAWSLQHGDESSAQLAEQILNEKP